MATPSRQQILDYIGNYGANNGLNREELYAAQAIAIIEGAGGSLVNQRDLNGQPDYGVYQFNTAGELAGFAAWAGIPFGTNGSVAGPYVVLNWQKGIEYALRPGGYLSEALKAGFNSGNRGPALVLYGFLNGQRGVANINQATAAYNQVPGVTLGSSVDYIGSTIIHPAGPAAQAVQSAAGGIQLPTITIPGAEGIPGAIQNAGQGVVNAFQQAINPFVSGIANLQQWLQFAGSEKTVYAAALLFIGFWLTLAGIILFGLSLVDPSSVGRLLGGVARGAGA